MSYDDGFGELISENEIKHREETEREIREIAGNPLLGQQAYLGIDETKQGIWIKVKYAENLKAVDLSSLSSDPFVSIKLESDRYISVKTAVIGQTSIKKKKCNPTYNEYFFCPDNLSSDFALSLQEGLSFLIYDHNKVSANASLGCAVMDNTMLATTHADEPVEFHLPVDIQGVLTVEVLTTGLAGKRALEELVTESKEANTLNAIKDLRNTIKEGRFDTMTRWKDLLSEIHSNLDTSEKRLKNEIAAKKKAKAEAAREARKNDIAPTPIISQPTYSDAEEQPHKSCCAQDYGAQCVVM